MEKNHKNKVTRYIIVYAALIILINVALFLNINTGSVHISFIRILQIIITGVEKGTANYNIIMKIRLPRLLLAAILGGALGLSGYLLQTFFRNPIAGPFVLGISSGAKMFVSFTMIILVKYLFKTPGNVPLYLQIGSAFFGAMFATAFVLIFSKRVKSMSMLLVIGVMIGYIGSAVTDFVITFADDQQIANLTHWALGSFASANWKNVIFAASFTFPLFLLTFLLSKPISAYLLGEGYAQSMGINVKSFRIIIILISSLLSATVTALAGPISFVGIAVPHIAKRLLNTSKPLIVIPAVFLTGSVFCLFCDLIARTIFSPQELAIGTVTSIFGAPIVIFLLIKNKKRSEQ